MRLCDVLGKAAEMGDHVIATTPSSKKPIWAGKGPAHEAYSSFTPAEHMAAANVHTARAKELHISSSRTGGSLTTKRQAQQHSQFATMHRQAAESKPKKLAASMAVRSNAMLEYARALHKSEGAGSRGGKVIGTTKSGKPIYAEHKATHDHYRTFSKKDHETAHLAHHKAGLDAQKQLFHGISQGHFGQDSREASQLKKLRAIHFDSSADHALKASVD